MVDRYYREIEDVENNIENAMQISSILLKLKGYDNDLSKIENNENNISSNSSQINTNENNISTNLSQINTNENNISTNSSQINTNENNISPNSSQINTNENNISTNLSQINTNENNISTNSSQINTNENNISTNLGKINTNENNISTNLGKINTNENNISTNLGKINTNENNISTNSGQINNIKNDLTDFKINYSIQNLFIFNIDVEKTYTLNKDNPKFSIFTYNMEDNFKSNSILEVNCKILYNYTSYNNIGTLIHIFKLYDENNELIYEYKNLKSNSGDNLSAFLNQNDLFYLKLNNNYSIIKIELILSILDNITKSVSCKLLNTFKSNFIYAKHYRRINTLSIDNNLTDLENDISTNLSKINNNETNISTNLSKIDTNKNNISTNLSKIDTNKNDI